MGHRPHHLQPSLDTVRVALAYRDFSGSCVSHVGLGVTAAYTAKTLRRHGVWAEVWPTQSAKKLGDRIRAANDTAVDHGDVRPTHVILSAPWIPTADLAQLATEFPEINFVVVSHSSVGFLNADPHAIRLLRETVDLQLGLHNVFMGGNSKKFTDWATEAWGVKAVWLPNLYCTEDSFPRQGRWEGGSLRLGLFGANRPLKNFLSSAAAIVELVNRLHVPTELLISTGRNEGGNFRAFTEMTENVPNLTIRETGWLTWSHFRKMLRTVDLVFQVSYTETFNVVTADAIAESVPVVVSDAIDWAPRWWQAHADEPSDITRVAEQLLRDPNAASDGRKALEEYVRKGLGAWRRFLCHDVLTMDF